MTFLESPMPQRDEIAFAAFAPLPKGFGEKDRQRLAVAVRVLGDGSQEYSRRTIFDLTHGGSVGAALLPDGVIVRFTVPKASLTNGVALMEGLLRRPVLDAASLDRALRHLQRGEPGYWTSALRSSRNALRSIGPEEARAVLRRVFNPARLVVAAAGGFLSGEAARRWEGRTQGWRPLPEPRYPDNSVAPPPTENPSGVTTVELRGAPFAASDPTLPARWLALIGLGVGKGSALFRDVRQVEGWSYRQEAVLWPDPAGLESRVLVAAAPSEGESGRAESLRTTLRTSVAGWTEADRTRALGMAAATLDRGLRLGPLWIADAPIGTGLADRATLDAYWYAKAGVRWDADRLLGTLQNVSLDEMKAQADAFLASALPIVLPGR